MAISSNESQVILRTPSRIIGNQAPRLNQTSDEGQIEMIPLPGGQEATKSLTTVNLLNQCPAPMTPCRSTLSHMGKGVIYQLQRYPHSYTFRDVIRLFEECDVDVHFDLMKSTILKYSFKIYGLPECPREDLFLAVHFFLEEVFGVGGKLELCVRFVEGDNPNVVGVVLDRIMTKHKILMQARCLKGTAVQLKSNKELDWILDGFIFNKTLWKDLTKKLAGRCKARVSLKF